MVKRIASTFAFLGKSLEMAVMSEITLSARLKTQAKAEGFTACGIAPANAAPESASNEVGA